MSNPSISPSWLKRPQEPASLPDLLSWLEQAAEPHLRVLAPDQCHVDPETCTNTGLPSPMVDCDDDKLLHDARVLWDEVARACDWLQDHGYSHGPVRWPETDNPHEAIRFYQTVRKWLTEQVKPKKTTRPVPLKPEDQAILLALAHDHPTTMTQEALADVAGLSVRTVGTHLAYLLRHKLVNRPRGQRGGHGITEAGLAYVDRR